MDERSQEEQWYSYWIASHRLPQHRWSSPPSYLDVPREVIGRDQEFDTALSRAFNRTADRISVVIGRSYLNSLFEVRKRFGVNDKGGDRPCWG
jgi:hypothetical protein